MKKILVILLFMPLLSCSIDSDNPVNQNLLGDWILVQTSGQFPNSTRTGSEMPFQETYTLKSNGTFEKTRIIEGEMLKISGTFEIKDSSEEMWNDAVEIYIYFHHESRSQLLATCYSDKITEHLYITQQGRLISTYNACDGIGLEYEQTVKN